jgi:hypothetical protein
MSAPSTGRHEADSCGPFGFLNPTIRRLPFEAKAPETPRDEDSLLGKGDGGTRPPKGENAEMRAEDVQREFRTRDNRKGTFSLRIRSIVPNLSRDSQADMPLP